MKEELEKKKKEEKAKRKQEEEERRQAEEEKKLVEKQRKQEEKQKKLEEAKRKKEEEKQRKETAAQRKKEEQARKLEEKMREEEESRRQRDDVKTTGGERPGQVENTEQGTQQHEMDHERLPHKVERVKNEGEETKTDLDKLRNDEEKQDKGDKKQEEADKQDTELLRTEDIEKKKLEKVTENEAGVKQETRDENEGEKKEGDENRVRKEEGKDRIVGEIDTNKQHSAPKKEALEEPHNGAYDSEQLPEMDQLLRSVQDNTLSQSQSKDTVTDTAHSVHTAVDSGPKNVQTTDSVKTSSRSATKLNCYSSVPKDWGDYLPETIDTKRLAWIKDCLSWR